jgi:DNA mismatch endonuclease (patch repair protein)
MPRRERTDVFSKAKRSEVMSRIRGSDTGPELLLRKALFALGLRYRLHVRSLPGCPDIVFRTSRTVVFVHGCFWHGHACGLFRWPQANREFWRSKIIANVARDRRAQRRLRADGWQVLTVWECTIRRHRKDLQPLARRVASRIRVSASPESSGAT